MCCFEKSRQNQEITFTFCFCCSVAKLCPTLCDPMDCGTPSFPVLHYLPEFAQTHVHWVDDASVVMGWVSHTNSNNFLLNTLHKWRKKWHPTPVLLPGKSHGRRRLVGCSPWGREESDTTERLYFHFSLSCIGEGNGNPLQCSCLENPRDGGAWWTAVYGVTQSRTELT